jgi:hypothetical protein
MPHRQRRRQAQSPLHTQLTPRTHPRGRANPTDEPARILAVSTKRFPEVVAYPEQGIAWVATHHPERPVPEGAEQGVIARIELPREK